MYYGEYLVISQMMQYLFVNAKRFSNWEKWEVEDYQRILFWFKIRKTIKRKDILN